MLEGKVMIVLEIDGCYKVSLRVKGKNLVLIFREILAK